MIQIYTYMIKLCLFFWLTLHKQMRCKDFHHALANPTSMTKGVGLHKLGLSKALRWKTWASASGRVDLGLDCGLSSAVLRTYILFIVRSAKIFIWMLNASPHLQWCKISSVKPKPKLHSCLLCEQYWPWRSTGQLARESSSSESTKSFWKYLGNASHA